MFVAHLTRSLRSHPLRPKGQERVLIAAYVVSRRLSFLALGVILAAAAILRLHGLSAASLWLDESLSWRQASQPFATMIRMTAQDEHPPLHNTILHLVILAFGDSEAALRLPSALFGIAAVGATFWAGSLAGGRAVGFLAATLLCLSGFHIHFSQEARPYALYALTATLFAGATLRALQSDRRLWHGASAAAALVLFYSHAYGLFLWLSVAVAVGASAWLLRNPAPKVLRRWAAWQAMPVLLFLPWGGVIAWKYGQLVEYGFWIREPTISSMRFLIEDIASGSFIAAALLTAAALVFVPQRWLSSGGVRSTSRSGDDLPQRSFIPWFLLAWLLGPLAIGLTLSLISQPILLSRHLIGSLPAWLTLASIGLCRLSRLWGRWVFALAAAGAIANWWFYLPLGHENIRAAVQAYVARAEPDDCVFVMQEAVQHEVRYYLRNPPPCFHVTDDPEDVTPWAFAAPRAWLFFGYVRRQTEGELAESLHSHGWRLGSVPPADPMLLELEPAK
jgi:mannosyltransferase